MNKAEVVAQTQTKTQSTPTRTTRRYVPLETVSAIMVSDDNLLAYGVVSNISESGACLIANTSIEPSHKVRIQFIKSDRTELFQTNARIVWSGEGIDPQMEIVGTMVGIAFEGLTAKRREAIAAILDQGSFHEIGGS